MRIKQYRLRFECQTVGTNGGDLHLTFNSNVVRDTDESLQKVKAAKDAKSGNQLNIPCAR